MHIHKQLSEGNFRFWINSFPLFEIAHRFGLALTLELPSDWSEDKCMVIRIHLIYPAIYICIPWPFKAFEDHYQCEGPRFGFAFHSDMLWLYHGNSTGKSDDKSSTIINMPWQWKHCEHLVLNKYDQWVPYTHDRENNSETHDYTYTLKSGEIQHREATINVEKRIWRRNFWLPRKLVKETIDINFNKDIGERVGSWKGGTLGCGYELLPSEKPVDSLRRMEKERKF